MVSPCCGAGLRRCSVHSRVVYNEGRGVPQDDAEAAKWFRLAAEQGVAAAQSDLGVSDAKGAEYHRTTPAPTCGLAWRRHRATKMQ